MEGLESLRLPTRAFPDSARMNTLAQNALKYLTGFRLRAFCRLQRLVDTGTILFLVVSRGGNDFLFVGNNRCLRAIGQDGVRSQTSQRPSDRVSELCGYRRRRLGNKCGGDIRSRQVLRGLLLGRQMYRSRLYLRIQFLRSSPAAIHSPPVPETLSNMTTPFSAKRSKVAVIAGAGPAGLTAALELLRRSDIRPMVFEADTQVGGISKTVNYRGNRMDLGGHRFFSKSDWVMQWWQNILPVAEGQMDSSKPLRVSYQQKTHDLTPDVLGPAGSDAVMLVRQRLSRIFYRRRFFDYPLKLNGNTLRNMGAAGDFENWLELRPRAI